MFENYHNWALKNKVMDLIGKDYSKMSALVSTSWPHGYYGVTKTGIPIYIERYSKIDIPKMLKEFTEEEFKDYYVNSY